MHADAAAGGTSEGRQPTVDFHRAHVCHAYAGDRAPAQDRAISHANRAYEVFGRHNLTAPRLGPLLRPFRQVAPLLAVAETTVPLIETHGSRINPSLSSDLAKLSRLRRIAGWVSRSPMDSDDYTAAVFELANMILLLDMNLLVFASRELRTHGPSLLRVVTTVGNVDAAISLASYRAGTMAWTRPVFQSQLGGSTMIGLRHPLLAEAVPNSIELAPPHGVLITGSNMSGKSTFLRTVGVNAILAQTLNTCLATAYHAPVFTVRSVIRRSDDLLAGKSYYRDEIDAVIALVHASQSRLPHLFLFDELFPRHRYGRANRCS